MVTDKWLTTVGAAAQTLFWAIGYFIGFTLVFVLSAGLLIPADFDEIGQRCRPWWRAVFRRQNRLYIAAEYVASLGWLTLSLVNLAFLLA
jgi:hypothetical protein